MSARKRRSRAGWHSMLAQGYTNEASGKWTKSTSQESQQYAARAARNAERNRENRVRRGLKRSAAWKVAWQEAKQSLERMGDRSDPLPNYISTFLRSKK